MPEASTGTVNNGISPNEMADTLALINPFQVVVMVQRYNILVDELTNWRVDKLVCIYARYT